MSHAWLVAAVGVDLDDHVVQRTWDQSSPRCSLNRRLEVLFTGQSGGERLNRAPRGATWDEPPRGTP
jgi:acyl carrier protein phosphodiesterase